MKFVIEEVYSNEYREGEIISHKPLAGMTVKTPVKVTVQVSKGSKEVTVPNVVGSDEKNAKKALKAEGLEVTVTYVFDKTVDEGTVIRQNPIANASAFMGDTVTITVSKGEDVAMVDMPSLIGLTEAEAKAKLSENELSLGAIIREHSDKPEGTVIKQSIPADSQLSKRTAVNITVSKGEKEEDPEEPETPPTDDPETPPSEEPEAPPSEEPDEPETPPTEEPEPTPEPEAPAKSTYNLTLNLPTGKESVNVLVKQSGSTVYNNTVSTAGGSITVTLTGSGSENIEVFFDGALVKTQKVNF